MKSIHMNSRTMHIRRHFCINFFGTNKKKQTKSIKRNSATKNCILSHFMFSFIQY